MTATYQYDVFGALKTQTGEADTNWRFTGELQDSTVGRLLLSQSIITKMRVP